MARQHRPRTRLVQPSAPDSRPKTTIGGPIASRCGDTNRCANTQQLGCRGDDLCCMRNLARRWLFGVALLLAGPWLVACGGTAQLPPAALAHNGAGAAALQQGDLEAASAHLELALEYNGEFVEALTNLGLVELARGNFGRARQLLGRARRLNPDFAQPHHGLGVLAEREFHPNDASDHYRAALAVDPGFAPSRANLARLLLQAGYAEHALVHYQKLIHSAPASVVSHRGRIETLLLLGRYDEAAAGLRLARGVFDEDPGLRLLHGRLELRRGRMQAAREAWNPLSGRRDDFGVAALAWLAVVELAEHDAEKAVDTAGRALKLDNEHPLATYVTAIALDDLRDPHARDWLERAELLNPEHPELRGRLQRPNADPR